MPLKYILPLLALISPFLLWPVEYFLPYPHVVEELFKAAIVLLVLSTKLNNTGQFRLLLLFGGLFALSETVFYLINIMFMGNLSTLLQRTILTTPLHIFTILIIWLTAIYQRWLIFIGLGMAMFIHYFYNSLQGF